MRGQQYTQLQLNPQNDDSIFGAGYLSRRSQNDLFVNYTSQLYYCSVVLEGKGILIDRDFNSYPITAGFAYQRFPGMAYTLHTDLTQPWVEYQIALSRPTMEALRTILTFHNDHLVFRLQLHPHLKQWMNEIANVVINASKDLRLETYFELQRLLLTIHLQEDDTDFSLALSIIRFACYTVMKNLQQSPSVQEIAESCNVSYGKLAQIFKQYTQSSPLQFLQHYKFCYADKLLHEGASIRDVAAMLGYSDQFSFSKQFKRSMGISPSESQRHRPVPHWDGKTDPEIELSR